MSGCGGGGSASTPNPNPQPATTTLQVNLGDTPSDRVVAANIMISSMSLTNTNGSTVNLVSTTTPVEMMHLMGAVQPVSLMRVPQGNYSGATLNLSSATVMYMDPSTHLLVQKAVAGPMTATVTFNPDLVVGTSPMVLNLDMNMASSVAIDALGNVTMTPTMSAAMNLGGSGSSADPLNGGMQHMTGTVASFSGSSFNMSMMQSSQGIPVSTGANTQFGGMSGMGGMSSGMIVMVDAAMQSDGTFMAQKVESVTGTSGGAMGGGLVTAITGSPATQLTLAMQEGAGTGMMSSNLAATTTANIASSATYNIDTDGMDMNGLPFTPAFGGTTIFKGQRVEVVSSSGMMAGGGMGGMMGGGTLTASEVELEQQGLSGTVSNYAGGSAPTTFTLTLPSDAAFATMTGSTAVTVFQQAGTMLHGMTSVSNGGTVHVRGLLFFDGGVYKLVASHIMAP